jgi:hypothetical protein
MLWIKYGTIIYMNKLKKLSELDLIELVPNLYEVLKNRDHFDIKSIASNKTLIQFNEQLLSYHPEWVKFLYQLREMLLNFLKIPYTKNFEPVYTTVDGFDDFFWLGVISDSHLTAHLGVLKKKNSGATATFYVFSIVHYHTRAGKFYFNLIRPFHHLVVHWMMAAAVKE